MRRYALTQGPRHAVAAVLEDLIGRARHDGKAETERDYRAALEAVDGGAEEVEAGPFVFRVTFDPHPAPLTHQDVREGILSELLAELEGMRADRAAQGRADRAEQYAAAIAELSGGAPAVRVHTALYQVAQAPV